MIRDESDPNHVWSWKSRLVGDLRLPTDHDLQLWKDRQDWAGGSDRESFRLPDPDEPVAVIIELNANYPGTNLEIYQAFERLWGDLYDSYNHGHGMEARITRISRKLVQCVLTRNSLAALMLLDTPASKTETEDVRLIHRVWPDYKLYPQIDRSAQTVKVHAARRSYGATGVGIAWAVVDTGIDSAHPHFKGLELYSEDPTKSKSPTSGLHRDFSHLVEPDGSSLLMDSPLTDEDGHGTHVAAIIAGACPTELVPRVADSAEPTDGGFVSRVHVGELQGMAPACELVSLKVFRLINGSAVTSCAAVIAALEYILTEVNVSRSALRVHGVNLSLGCEWKPDFYAAGQSPLCQLIAELVGSGVNVVISAGNEGSTLAPESHKQSVGVLASITEPGHADACITVGSTHRDAPHVFGVSWNSSKGPTLDGRSKPDVVAPGEWICSAAAGKIRTRARLDGLESQMTSDGMYVQAPTYAEQSGTSMAAPHVSGLLAGFLSSRPEYIGRPAEVKALLIRSAVDLGRDRYHQGTGLVDAMRMLAES